MGDMVSPYFSRVFVSTMSLESFSLTPEKFSKRFPFSGGSVRFVLCSPLNLWSGNLGGF